MRTTLAFAVALLCACATAQPAPAVWSNDLSKHQKMAVMKQRVLPTMRPLFAAHDATRYARFDCVTCHGPDDKDPHDYLPKLSVKDGIPTALADKPAISKFMASDVVPNMASAMGLPPFDPATKQGFGCAGCHAMVEVP